MNTITKPEPLLWLDSSRGVYIPRDFAQSFKDRAKHVSGVNSDDWDVLEDGPNNELYWEVWTELMNDAIITDENGIRYSVYHDGDCWLIPDGMSWDDKTEWFTWENSNEA